MKKVRFKKHTTGSFFGSFLYDQIIPKNHFLVKAKEIIDWDRFTQRCIRWYKGSCEIGRAPYNPAVMLKMLFVSYLYNLSERQVEERVNLDLAFKYFVGLGVDEIPPDHSSLTYFKERLLKGGGKTAYDELLREILVQAKEKGIKFGSIQIIDSVHTIADINTDKERRRKDKGDKPPQDPDASWGVKHQRKVKDPETGQSFKQTEYFHGYKAHTSLNAQSGLITSVKSTTGKANDGKQLPTIIAKDNFTPLPRQRIYTGDKAYDDGENHEILKTKKFGDALRLKITRTKKKNSHKEPWLKLLNDKRYQQGLKERYKIERKFGEAKLGHGLRRCRSLGLEKFHLQATLTAIVLDIKVVVAQITGTTLKGYVYQGGCFGLQT